MTLHDRSTTAYGGTPGQGKAQLLNDTAPFRERRRAHSLLRISTCIKTSSAFQALNRLPCFPREPLPCLEGLLVPRRQVERTAAPHSSVAVRHRQRREQARAQGHRGIAGRGPPQAGRPRPMPRKALAPARAALRFALGASAECGAGPAGRARATAPWRKPRCKGRTGCRAPNESGAVASPAVGAAEASFASSIDGTRKRRAASAHPRSHPQTPLRPGIGKLRPTWRGAER